MPYATPRLPARPSRARHPWPQCRPSAVVAALALLLAWGGVAAARPAAGPAETVASAHTNDSGWEEAAGLLGSTARRFTEGWKEPGRHWRVAVSPFTHHWNFSEEHREVYAIALEQQRADGWLAGASRFRNSFGQPSAYLYVGWRSGPLWEVEPLFLQWSAGLLYGYRGRFEDKVPLNMNGFSPGALVGLGWHAGPRSSVMVHALAAAGLMLQLSWDLR
jgi:hypothetical protein